MPESFFHVFIIESPSNRDFLDSRFEGRALKETLELSGVSASHVLVTSKEMFYKAFAEKLLEHFKKGSLHPITKPPVIHISAHGDKEGIGLTNGEKIKWDELKPILLPLNSLLDGYLLLCLSSCEGFWGHEMAMRDENFPFNMVIGSVGKPTWDQTNVGYAAFYHNLNRKKELIDCVKAMIVASDHKDFNLISCKDARKIYLDNTKPAEAAAIVDTLEKNISFSKK